MLNRGDILDNTYQIIEEIGKGSGGIIYKAMHLRLHKYVVVKKVRDNVKGIINIRGEADILKNLRHSYLPQVYDFLQTGNQVYTVIDFIPGQSLSYYLSNNYKFLQKDLIKWAKQLCEALAYLHNQIPPIIHSDIKPANIMITPEGNVCLIDFNVSLGLGQNERIFGMSPGYASPEQMTIRNANGARAVIDTRTDIYSFGAVLYHLMTGVKPDSENDLTGPLHSEQFDYSPVFADIVMRALCEDMTQRYQNVNEILKDLKNLHRLDRRYQKHRRLQHISTITGVALISISLVISYLGHLRIAAEKLEYYDTLVWQGQQYAGEGSYQAAEKYFEIAIAEMADRLPAYYEKIYLLSKTADQEQTINYARMVLAKPELAAELGDSLDVCAQIEYIIGNAYFEMENYEEACGYYLKALQKNTTTGVYYRDYAIALCRMGNVQEAKGILDKALAQKMNESDILLVQAEIDLQEKKYEAAITKFNEVIFRESIKGYINPYLLQRAYVLCAGAYRAANDIDGEIALLEEARERVWDEHTNIILSGLGEAYARKAKQTAEDTGEYVRKAIQCYEELARFGNPGFNIQLNLIILYQAVPEFDQAKALLKDMEVQYPGDYRVYMNWALLLCSEQSERLNDQRDYREAEEYYKKAVQYYETERISGKSDAAMQQLDSIMNRLYEEGWLKR